MKRIMWKRSLALLLAVILLPVISPVLPVSAAENTRTIADDIQLDCGGDRTAVISADGTLQICGYNYHGELGSEEVKPPDKSYNFVSPTINQNKKETLFSKVSNGNFHTAAVTKDGQLWVWGSNEYGQLGTGNTKDSEKPVRIKLPGNEPVFDVVASDYCTAAVTTDGKLYTWGMNVNGILGQGEKSFTYKCLSPKDSSVVLNNVMSFSIESSTAIASLMDGTVWVWGSNYNGSLGIEPSSLNGRAEYVSDSITKPILMNKLDRVIKVSAGYWWTAAINEDHELYTWGRNNNHALGQNSSDQYRVVPQKILDQVTDVSISKEHGAALTEKRELFTWGYGSSLELGQKYEKKSPSPKKILDKVIKVSFGPSHCAAIDQSGWLYTWGHR